MKNSLYTEENNVEKKIKHQQISIHIISKEKFSFIIDTDTKCLDATSLCILQNKNLSVWENLPRTKELIKFYSQTKTAFHQYHVGYGVNKHLFIIKELFIDLSFWISPQCYYACCILFLTFNNL
ncbi:MAG: KilA-N domain-containing protein [Enterobacter sp.]